jgi:mycothiol synthase
MKSIVVSAAYTGASDLLQMQNALAQWMQQAGDSIYWHVGDVPHRLYDNLSGLFPLDAVVRLWKNAAEIIGFAVAQPDSARFDAFLHPDYRGTNVERDIVTWAYKIVGQDANPVRANVYAGDATRLQILLAMGFEKDVTYLCMTQRALLDKIDAPALPNGCVIRPAGIDDAIALQRLHQAVWDWQPERSYQDAVMLKPGYKPERELLAVTGDGVLAAHTIYWLDSINKLGYFEPVGTHPAYQRKGLARALMNHAMRLMREQGMEQVRVCFNFQNDAAKNLYTSLGFQQVGSITHYLKQAHKEKTI